MTNIGGINFKAEDVISFSSQRTGTRNMKPLFKNTVETKFGTFEFYDQEEDKNKSSTIFTKTNGQVVIDNCNIQNLKGTKRADNYLINDTNVGIIDTKGDYGNRDTVTLTGKSKLHFKSTDDDDKVVDLTSNGAPGEYIPIQYEKEAKADF